MKHDLLTDAARALRELHDEPPARPSETRARVLATMRRRRTRHLTLLKRVLPLAALLLTSTAWAAATGRLPASLQRAAAVLGFAPPPPPAAPPGLPAPLGPPAAPPAPIDDPAPPAVVAAPPPAPLAPSAPAPVDDLASPALATAPPPATVAPPPAPVASAPPRARGHDDPAAHALYTAAHQQHFGAQQWGRALIAWDAYLKAAPRGRFAAEAHYNRALCLVRLGRLAEARRSLEAFAGGAFGGYRQSEARALLEALSGP